jgi:quercetin dioxygenase-like cupin family protein
MEDTMIQLSKKLVFISLLSTTLMTAAGLNAADSPVNANGLVVNASDIQYRPAPGFPKGAQITLLRGDLSKPVPYTIRFKLPNGFVIPSHWHSLDEEVTVLSGILNVGSGDTVDKSQSTALSAGGFQIVPANLHHYVWSTGETVFQVDGMGPRTTAFVNPEEWTALIKQSNK